MSHGLGLDPQGDFPLDLTGYPVPGATQTVNEVDPVRALTRVMHRSNEAAGLRRRNRPFDAHYWACWVVAVVWPLLMAYLLFLR